jgi:hypothetical protein
MTRGRIWSGWSCAADASTLLHISAERATNMLIRVGAKLIRERSQCRHVGIGKVLREVSKQRGRMRSVLLAQR